MTNIFDFSAPSIDGRETALSQFAGNVLLVVNVASKCGLTPQYAGLEDLWRTYRDKGLVVLGFPCNQFAGQEPGNEAEIAEFCSLTYDVTFPLFAKVDVNGEAAHPLFKALKAAAPGNQPDGEIEWNFNKFLVSRDGAEVQRFAPSVLPETLFGPIEDALDR